ncbi:MAG: DUF1788 domain-containing protein [Anaerolineaceae bacterium]|nr:DUF1788 domain-containing protein [Anaerolineaceae bacterium]
MSSLKERVELLEKDLRSVPMRHFIYSDLPFAVFVYPPDEEWEVRGEIKRLIIRLENDKVRRVVAISLADLLWQAIDESEGMKSVIDLESKQGFLAAQNQVYDYLTDDEFRSLPTLLSEKLANFDAQNDLVFLVRTGALAPDLYRVSVLLDQMKGKTRVPCVLFMPATADGSDGLRFMGLSLHERRGSYHTRVYID